MTAYDRNGRGKVTLNLNQIKVKSLEFGTPPFRKLGKFTVEFADRLTVIAGHNGIGKSTILGLVANTFGTTAKNGHKSYFGDLFYANIERIVFLALEEVAKAQEHPAAAPIVVADVGGLTVRKRCALTQRSAWKRARVVPRTVDKAADDHVGQDAKIPLPTIYLGIRRLASIGEANEKEVISQTMSMNILDSQLMVDFVKSVILGSDVTTDITHQSIKGSGKKTTQPGYKNHNALAVSMGQDSLGSIATALASFNRLKRDLGNEYPGGLLVVDELDVGFHPHAISRLATALKKQAKTLNLQIICTSHSPRLVEAIHPEGDGNKHSPDTVIYLLDTRNPRLAPDQSLAAVLDDMELRSPNVVVKSAKPLLCIYFEDLEGKQFCEELVPQKIRTSLNKKNGVRIKLISLSVGGSNLVALPDKDPYFKDRLIIVDADTLIPVSAAARGNTFKLPCVHGATGTGRSPENTIKKFLRDVAQSPRGPLHDALLRFTVKNPSSDKITTTFFPDNSGESDKRDSSKSWWVTHWKSLKSWGVIREWMNFYPTEVNFFTAAFEKAVSNVAKRLK